MKSRKVVQRAGALCGALCVGALLSGAIVTRLLPPWVPLSWRPRRVAEPRQHLA